MNAIQNHRADKVERVREKVNKFFDEFLLVRCEGENPVNSDTLDDVEDKEILELFSHHLEEEYGS